MRPGPVGSGPLLPLSIDVCHCNINMTMMMDKMMPKVFIPRNF